MPSVVIWARISSARASTVSRVAWGAAGSSMSSVAPEPSSSTVTVSMTVTVTGTSARLPAASSAQ